MHNLRFVRVTNNLFKSKFNLLFPFSASQCIVVHMNSCRYKFLCGTSGALVALFLLQTVIASEFERVNRYSLHELTAESNQVDLLSSVIETRFPPFVETVGTAIDYVLHRSGYKHIATEEIESTLELPLPESHRSIGPVDARTAVRTIVGQTWKLYEDSGQRILWFQRAGVDSEKFIQPPVATSATDVQSNTKDSIIIESDVAPTSWHLQSSLTLRENLENWAQLSDWSLDWRSRHDYAITHPSTFSGTLVDAVGSLLMHYQNAPVPLVGKFFSGNSVLVIEPSNYP